MCDIIVAVCKWACTDQTFITRTDIRIHHTRRIVKGIYFFVVQVVAYPTAILSARFLDVYNDHKREQEVLKKKAKISQKTLEISFHNKKEGKER